ncbi:MAG: Uma2 family endonuclease [Methylococcaceae bacterium]|nr:Uma2 family endonuclease [Methylococcaceae bacterium]
MNTAEQLKISVDDYLQGELISEIKYEYINGEVYAMSGARRAHNIISMTLSRLLGNHLHGSACQVYGSDMKVGILTNTDDFFYYADVHVSCEQSDNDLYNVEPKLIVEVLSDSTERKDRAEKFHNYRKLESLEEYVLVAQDTKRVEVYSREENWDLALFEEAGDFYLNSVDLRLDLADVYQNVVLDSK